MQHEGTRVVSSLPLPLPLLEPCVFQRCVCKGDWKQHHMRREGTQRRRGPHSSTVRAPVPHASTVRAGKTQGRRFKWLPDHRGHFTGAGCRPRRKTELSPVLPGTRAPTVLPSSLSVAACSISPGAHLAIRSGCSLFSHFKVHPSNCGKRPCGAFPIGYRGG